MTLDTAEAALLRDLARRGSIQLGDDGPELSAQAAGLERAGLVRAVRSWARPGVRHLVLSGTGVSAARRLRFRH